MSARPFEALACPLDGATLHKNSQSWRCASGHSFDVARQGYVHLLPVQNKRTREPGDNRDMVAARQRFLATGLYQPIAEAVSSAVLHGAEDATTLNCLDAGCGEGYYLRHLAQAAPQRAPLALMGLDISKWAILSAARQDKTAAWVVGSNANLPVLPETLDRILCLFGFPVYTEFARVLRAGGEIVQADAGAEHLRQLREIIYPELKPPGAATSEAPVSFTRVDTSTVHYSLELPDRHAIADLLAMTPHLYRAGADGLARLAKLDSLTVTVDVRIRRFRRG